MAILQGPKVGDYGNHGPHLWEVMARAAVRLTGEKQDTTLGEEGKASEVEAVIEGEAVGITMSQSCLFSSNSYPTFPCQNGKRKVVSQLILKKPSQN